MTPHEKIEAIVYGTLIGTLWVMSLILVQLSHPFAALAFIGLAVFLIAFIWPEQLP